MPSNADNKTAEANFKSQENVMSENNKSRDVFRDTPIRLLGYANEVGEAFRSMVSRTVVRATYGVAICYVVADATHKGSIAYKKFEGSQHRNRLVTQGVVDVLIWQGLASVAIPGFTINRLCWLSNRVLAGKVALTVAKGISTAIGLAAIPFIVKPIDTSVDWLMNTTLRRWLSYSDRLNKNHIVLHHRSD